MGQLRYCNMGGGMNGCDKWGKVLQEKPGHFVDVEFGGDFRVDVAVGDGGENHAFGWV